VKFDTDPIGGYSFVCKTSQFGEYSVKYRKKKWNAFSNVIGFEVTDLYLEYTIIGHARQKAYF
jgi:hypothetical protein